MKKVPQDVVATIRSDIAISLQEMGENSKYTVENMDKGWNPYISIWEEQLGYIEDPNKGWYYFAAFDKNHSYLGGVTVFLEGEHWDVISERPAMQGIAKSRLGVGSGVRLNSLLIPAIINFLSSPDLLKAYSALKLHYTRITVKPVYKQKEILKKHFGFKFWRGYYIKEF